MSSQRPVRALILHTGVFTAVDEGGEVWQQVAGIVEADQGSRLEVSATDCQRVRDIRWDGREAAAGHDRSLWRTLLRGVDVVHVHLAIPQTQLLLALLFRLRGARVVFSPMAFLNENFGQSSWTYTRPGPWRWLKPRVLRALRAIWLVLATRFVCLSADEVTSSRLPSARCVLAPWPLPSTALLDAITEAGEHAERDEQPPHQRPVAFVSRWDPWRKGIDRMTRWLAAQEAALPRPAVALLTPRPGDVPEALLALEERGLLRWDAETRAAALLPALQRCRGVMLLSRFDGQPRVLREAAALGLPTISTPSSNFSEVVDLLGVGAIVDGDDPKAVQRAFEDVADQPVDHRRAAALFDRRQIGQFLADILVATARGTAPQEPSYYRWARHRLPAPVVKERRRR